MPVRTHYDNLKVARDAPIEVIRAAFLALSIKYGHEEQILGVINRAYTALSDPLRRSEHDAWIVEQESRKEPPAPPLPLSSDGKRPWTAWVGSGIALAVVFCMVVFVASDPHKPQSIAPDSRQAPIAPVSRAENPPLQVRTVTVPDPPAKVGTVKSKAVADSMESPSSVTKYRFIKPPRSESPRSEIDDVIKSGRYSRMPPAEVVSPSTGSGPSRVSVVNQTAYTLTVTFYGSAERSVKIGAGQSLELDLAPETYRVLGRTTSLTVLPFVGNQDYSPGAGYKLTFYIIHQIVP